MVSFQPLPVHVDPNLLPIIAIGKPRLDSAATVDELLNANHNKNHTFFTKEEEVGVYMHNHLVHHALTLYALGAPPDVIVRNHVRNQLYQRVSPAVEPAVIQNLDDSATFQSSLGKEEHYLNFVRYFEQQVQKLGWSEFFDKFLFGDTELANDMICRLFAGYLHPILGVGFAVEFHQPPILAEAFAQAAVHHDDHLMQFLQAADAAATTGVVEPAPLADIIEAASKDPTVKSSADIKFFRQFNENGEMRAKLDHIRDGVIAVAGPKVVELAAKWQVKPNEIEQKTAELINTAAYVVCGAQRKPYECRFDFFTLHGLTTSVFYSSFLREPAITPEGQSRLVEYLGRMIIALYAGAGSPDLDLEWTLSHPPKVPNSTWESITERAWAQEDDGHMCKIIRALKNVEQVSKPFDTWPEFRLKQGMFLPLANTVIDCGSLKPMRGGIPLDWIRCPGLDEAWEKVPHRSERVDILGVLPSIYRYRGPYGECAKSRATHTKIPKPFTRY